MSEKLVKVGIKKEQGYLYFVDKDGDVSRAKMARGRKKNKSEQQPEPEQKEPAKNKFFG